MSVSLASSISPIFDFTTCTHDSSLLKSVESFSKLLGYSFRDSELLKTALTHRSMLNSCAGKHASNERLEFLGDSTLEIIIRKFLFDLLPKSCEGDLSQLKDCIVSKAACFRYALIIELEKFMFISDDVPMTNDKARRTILADGFEAVLGAIFLDGGYLEAEKFLLGKTRGAILEIIENPPKNWKQELQHHLQKKYKCIPNYEVTREEDLGYFKCFEVVVTMDEFFLGKGEGSSKKEAQQDAAEKALENLKKGLSLSKIERTGLSLMERFSRDSLPGRTLLREVKGIPTFQEIESTGVSSIEKLTGESFRNRTLLRELKGTPIFRELEQISALEEPQSTTNSLEMLRRLINLHRRVADLLKRIDLGASGLSSEEQAFFKAHRDIPLPRKKISSRLFVEGRARLVQPAAMERPDLSSVSDWTRSIFLRIQSNDRCLTVHFLHETLSDRDLVCLGQCLESNTVLHHLYLSSLAIGKLGMKALKKILLFDRTLTLLRFSFPSNIKSPLLQMVHSVLKININETLLDLRLWESGASGEGTNVHLTRSFGSRFNLQTLEDQLYQTQEISS